MKLDSKKILTIGAGAVVGYLLFCKLIKSGGEKSLEGGAEAPAEEGGIGGGGGGFGGGGGSIAPLPPIVAPIIPAGYVTVGNNVIAPLSALQVGNPNTLGGTVTTQPTRETPPAPAPPKPLTDVSGATVSSAAPKFTDFDGNMNQDAIL
jgi:hypothetical protein